MKSCSNCEFRFKFSSEVPCNSCFCKISRPNYKPNVDTLAKESFKAGFIAGQKVEAFDIETTIDAEFESWKETER